MFLYFSEEYFLLIIIGFFNSFYNIKFITVILRSFNEGLDIFRKTGSAIACSRIKKLIAYSGIAANTFPYLIDISSQDVA